jgi:hypothetical protein
MGHERKVLAGFPLRFFISPPNITSDRLRPSGSQPLKKDARLNDRDDHALSVG